jgi:uncharacterized metal-binding protein YceD (DUF177 family)
LQQIPRNFVLNKTSPLLALNVGFLIKEDVGYSRTLEYAEAQTHIGDDLDVRHLRGTLNLTRTPQGILVQGTLTGDVAGECSRCLDAMPITLRGRVDELYYYPPAAAPEPELAIPDDLNLDLAPVIRDDLLLSLPIQALCRPDCKGLCPTCGINLNRERCDCATDDIDPRLAKLRDLLKDEPGEAPGA